MSLTFGSSWGDRGAGNLDLSPRTSCTGGWWAGWCGLWGQSHAGPYCIRLPLTNSYKVSFYVCFWLVCLFVCFCLIIRTAMLAKWFYEFWILVWSQWQPPVFTTHKFNKRGWDAARGHSFRSTDTDQDWTMSQWSCSYSGHESIPPVICPQLTVLA